MDNDPKISNKNYIPTKEEFLNLFEGLTKRQKQVVLMKCQGMSDLEIALECGFQESNTRKHLNNALMELLISDPDVVRNNGKREVLIRLGMMYLSDKFE